LGLGMDSFEVSACTSISCLNGMILRWVTICSTFLQ